MFVGYGVSCLTRLYDIVPGNEALSVDPNSQASQGTVNLDPSNLDPVWPPWQRAQGRDWKTLLAEAPMVPPPTPDKRPIQLLDDGQTCCHPIVRDLLKRFRNGPVRVLSIFL